MFTVAVWLVLPLVPVMVRVEVPDAELLVLMFSVELPEPLTEVGFNVAVTPAGAPLTLNPTVPLKPFSALTVAVVLVELPAATVSELDAIFRVKSGWALTDSITVAVCEVLPLVPVMVSV